MRFGSLDLDLLSVSGVEEVATRASEKAEAISKLTKPGDSGSCHDLRQLRDFYVPSPMCDCAKHPLRRPGPRRPIAIDSTPPLRALVYEGCLDTSSTCLSAPLWSIKVSS